MVTPFLSEAHQTHYHWSDDDAFHKHTAARATSAGKMAILTQSETAHDGHLADNFNIAHGEW